MKVVIQRVHQAAVAIEGATHAQIDHGLLILLGITTTDTQKEAEWLAGKVAQMRIFSDDDGKMNHSLKDTKGEALVVSQFTLYSNARKGNRPSYIEAARPEQAIPLYEYFVQQLSKQLGKAVATGVFGADMQVSLVNDGPVTIVLES